MKGLNIYSHLASIHCIYRKLEAQQENARFHSHLVVINLYELAQSFVTCKVIQDRWAQKASTFCFSYSASAAEFELSEGCAAWNVGHSCMNGRTLCSISSSEHRRCRRDYREWMTWRDSPPSLPTTALPCIAQMGLVHSSLSLADGRKANSWYVSLFANTLFLINIDSHTQTL